MTGEAPEIDLAGHIRDARSNENPCEHWIGQEMAVCSPCLRDRIAPHFDAHGRTGWALYNELVDRHNVERLHLQAVIDELKDLLSRACAQDATEDCWFDHNGGCQAHGFLSGACPYPLIRQYVDPTYSPVPTENVTWNEVSDVEP